MKDVCWSTFTWDSSEEEDEGETWRVLSSLTEVTGGSVKSQEAIVNKQSPLVFF
jgi:hypothetical protein